MTPLLIILWCAAIMVVTMTAAFVVVLSGFALAYAWGLALLVRDVLRGDF